MDGTHWVFESQVWLSGGFNKIIATAGGRDSDNVLYQNSSSDDLSTAELTDGSASWDEDEFAGRYLEVDGGFALITGNTATVLHLIDSDIGLTGGGLAYRIRSSRETSESAGVMFQDEIQIYYQKDNSIFNFVEPMANESFKASSSSYLTVKGEIDSLYKTSYDPATGIPEENRVQLWITHIPRNAAYQPTKLAEGELAVIKPSDFAHGTITSKYLFISELPIPLEGLEDGELEIVAYKNRDGDVWDDKITRLVYIDAGRLWIDIVQPNIFTSDLLDSKKKIEDFNNGPVGGNNGASNDIDITSEGTIILQPEGLELEEEAIAGLNRIVEGPDGTIYGLVNTSASFTYIYEKKPGESDWRELLAQPGMYVYDMVFTPIGILLGASNIPSNANSGLYLLNEGRSGKLQFSWGRLAPRSVCEPPGTNDLSLRQFLQ